MQKVIPKRELVRLVHRFLKNKDRGISVHLFAQLCGISPEHLKDVFLYQTEPLSETFQRRVSKGFISYMNGEVAVMQNQDKTRFVEYRKIAKPIFKKTYNLQLVGGEIKLNLGIRNKHDYSLETLDEQLERG